MGRGRQKAKQTKIARKLKYLTTDTDYDELAKELSDQDSSVTDTAEQADPFADIDKKFQQDHELDEYAQWAAEAAAKAEEQAAAAAHKPIPIPVPSALKKAKPAASPLAAVAKATVAKAATSQSAATGAAGTETDGAGRAETGRTAADKTATKPAVKRPATAKPATKKAATPVD